jgi:hypothetical protein
MTGRGGSEINCVYFSLLFLTKQIRNMAGVLYCTLTSLNDRILFCIGMHKWSSPWTPEHICNREGVISDATRILNLSLYRPRSRNALAKQRTPYPGSGVGRYFLSRPPLVCIRSDCHLQSCHADRTSVLCSVELVRTPIYGASDVAHHHYMITSMKNSTAKLVLYFFLSPASLEDCLRMLVQIEFYMLYIFRYTT